VVVESVQERLSEHFFHLGGYEGALEFSSALEGVLSYISWVALDALKLIIGLLNVLLFVSADSFHLYHLFFDIN
jgi:hypothetical protein